MRISDWSSDVCSSDLIFADLGAIFEIAVIVASDGAGADIGVRTDADIAEIAQVLGLGALADLGLFGFDDITTLCLFAQYGSGEQSRIGHDLPPCADRRALDMPVGAASALNGHHNPGTRKDVGLVRPDRPNLGVP